MDRVRFVSSESEVRSNVISVRVSTYAREPGICRD